MYYKTLGIALHAIPYNDKCSIVYVYTEAFGRVSYLVSRVRGKKSSVSKSLFIPLSVLDMEVDHLNNRELQRIREAKLCFPVDGLMSDPVKNALSLFLSEVIFRVIKQSEADPRLFAFLADSIRLLSITTEGVANFHLVFLIRLLNYLGFKPNTDNYSVGSFFDLQNGVFLTSQPLNTDFLKPDDSIILMRLLRMNYENMSVFRFTHEQRSAIIERILNYYRLHLPGLYELKSLAVMQSLFS